MTTRDTGAPQARARKAGGTRTVHLPEKVGLALPAGWLDRIDECARHDGMTRAGWIRAALRRGFDLARKQRGAK